MVLVISVVDFRQVWSILKKIDLLVLLCSFLSVLIVLLTKAWRWKYILDKQQIQITFKGALSFYLSSVYIGLLTPGRVGEFGKAVMINKRCASYGKSFFGVFLERAMDLAILLSLTLWGLPKFFWDDNKVDYWYYYALVILTAIGVLAIIWYLRPLRILERFSSKKIIAGILSGWSDFKGEFVKIPPAKYLFFGLLSSIGWFLYFLILFFLTVEINIHLTFLDVIQLAAISSVVAILPVSYLGLGTRDATLIYLFSVIHLGSSAAIAFSCLFLLIYFFTFVICAISWFFFSPTVHNPAKQ